MAEPHSAPPTPPGNEPPDADAPGMGLPGTLIEDPSGMTAADQQGAAEAAAESRRKRQEQQASGSVLAPLSAKSIIAWWLMVVPGPRRRLATVAAGMWTTPRSSRTVIALLSRCTMPCSTYRKVTRSVIRASWPTCAGGVPGMGFTSGGPA